jgi:phage shock protein C
MRTRTRKQAQEQDDDLLFRSESNVDLESMTDDEIEDLLFDEEKPESRGVWNLPTIAGLSLILVGTAYLFQELGVWNGFDLSVLVGMLPWLAGILIILLGLGVLSWRPKRKKRRVRKAVHTRGQKEKVVVETTAVPRAKRRLVKTRDKKVAGVCGGVAEYFSIDPTLVRIAFVIGTIATQGSFLIAYLILAYVMPKPEPLSLEERITIIRDR